MVPVWFALGYVCKTYLPVLEPAAWGMAFFTLLNYCVRRESEGRWPDYWLFRWLFAVGIFSYSMYLVHPVVAEAAVRLSGGATKRSTLGYMVFAVFVAVCCVIAGKIYYELVERHFLNTSPKARAPKVELLGVGREPHDAVHYSESGTRKAEPAI